jgi:hypothetical protein
MMYPCLVMHQVGKTKPKPSLQNSFSQEELLVPELFEARETRDLQMEMSSSDRDGEFRCAFHMSLEKVQHLTKN